MGGAGKRLCIRGLRVIVCLDCHLDHRQERTILIGRGGRWKYAQRLPEEVLASCSQASTDLDPGGGSAVLFFLNWWDSSETITRLQCKLWPHEQDHVGDAA